MANLENHEAEKEILQAVCSEFAATCKSTPRKPLLIRNSRNFDMLAELERGGLLRRRGDRQDQFVPSLGAFYLCGDEKVLEFAKGGVLAVTRGAKRLFEEEEESDRTQFTFQELLDKLQALGQQVDEQQVRLGLYLAQEFGVATGWPSDNKSNAITNFQVYEQIVTIDDPEARWEEQRHRYSFPVPMPSPVRQTVSLPYDDEPDADEDEVVGAANSPSMVSVSRTTEIESAKQSIFVSCGQRTEEERNLGSEVVKLINSNPKFSAYFADMQSSLRGLHENILEKLEHCAGFIAIMHPRGTVSFSDGKSFTRASVWVEQEIAIAAFIQRTKKHDLKVAAYCHRDVDREGLRDLLHLNPMVFETSDEILSHLTKTLRGWKGVVSSPVLPSRGEGASVSFTSVRGNSVPGFQTALVYVNVNNTGKTRIKEYSATISVPSPCLSWSSASYMAEIPTRMTGYRSFRNSETSFGKVPIHQGDRLQVVSIEIAVANLKTEDRADVLNMEVVADVEADGEVLQARKPVRDLIGNQDAQSSAVTS